MGANLRGDLTPVEVAASGAGARMSLVLGDDGRQFGEFGNLMPRRLGVSGCRFGRQHGLAVAAGRGYIRYDMLDPLGREAMAMMSGMPSLPARFASAGCLDHRLGCPKRIGRRRCRGVGGIATQLRAEFVDIGL
jgi:hypothetical protein